MTFLFKSGLQWDVTSTGRTSLSSVLFHLISTWGNGAFPSQLRAMELSVFADSWERQSVESYFAVYIATKMERELEEIFEEILLATITLRGTDELGDNINISIEKLYPTPSWRLVSHSVGSHSIHDLCYCRRTTYLEIEWIQEVLGLNWGQY